MARYWAYVTIGLICAIVYQYSDVSEIKIKAMLIMMLIIQCYILYELVKHNSKA